MQNLPHHVLKYWENLKIQFCTVFVFFRDFLQLLKAWTIVWSYRKKPMVSSEWYFFRSRRLRWPHGAIWMSFYVLLCIVGQNFCCEEESLAASLKQLCFCHNKHTLHCQGINDTHLFKTTPQSSFQGNLFVWKKN